MNKTQNGRWGRYRVTDYGVKEKKCNGPLHPPEGAWLPLTAFWVFRDGPRKGRPLNYCIECARTTHHRDPKGGYIKVGEVRWIFLELRNRLGKAETIRRCGLSTSFWTRLEKQQAMKRATVRRAVLVLMECRKNDEVRHRKSIRYGASQRGTVEKTPKSRHDLYTPYGDIDEEQKRKWLDKKN